MFSKVEAGKVTGDALIKLEKSGTTQEVRILEKSPVPTRP